jgi:hypothetical protein
MNEQGFIAFLKKGGRSERAIRRCVAHVRDFEQYLLEHKAGQFLDEADADDLLDYVQSVENGCQSAKTHLWAIRYYYEFVADEAMVNLARDLRAQRIERAPLQLKDFMGVSSEHINRLASKGITDTGQMLLAGCTVSDQEELATKTGVPLNSILELVKLSDLARIPGMKGVRARLYYDAGVDTPEELAEWDPESIREILVEFVEQTGFEGLPPWPKEVAFSVRVARELPRVVEY